MQGALLTAALAVCPPAFAAESTSLGTFKQWTALSFPDDGGTSCMIWSQPDKLQAGMEGRGEVFVFVTHRSAPRQFDAVTLHSGYAFREGSQAKVSIGNRHFTLATSGSSAWTRSPADNTGMVKAMRAGYSMTVSGTSAGGKRTTDTYSLLGFSAAHDAIDRACGRG